MSGRAKKPAAPRKKANGYKMPAPIPNGFVIHDTTMKKKWRIGPSIGVGGFGEIYSACDHESSPKKGSSYPYVIKIEPHENGPLFVEKHFYVRNCNKDDITKFMKSQKLTSLGMPMYHGNGSFDYNGEKYRYLVLERYGKDLWTVFKDSKRRFPPATVFQIGLQMLDVLEYIHSRGYVHADVKGANILLGLKKGTENQAYLVDFGLASRVNDKEFKPDPKCAHNGTIEYTSRDAHLGVATMRGDLEILAYNMLQWIVGSLVWEGVLNQPKAVQEQKERFMKNIKKELSSHMDWVPDALIKFFDCINALKPKDVPDYGKFRTIIEAYLKEQGKSRSSKLDFTVTESKKTSKTSTQDTSDGVVTEKPKKRVTKQVGDATKVKKVNGDATKVKKVKKPVILAPDSASDGENEEPVQDLSTKKTKTTVLLKNKRKSSEPLLLVKVKKAKLAPKVTPPVKRNHVNISTQTSDNRRKSPRQVSFDSPICEIIGEKKPLKSTKNKSIDSSGDIFEDSFVIQEKKVKPKKRLLSDEEVIVKKVVKKKTMTVQAKGKSWKDMPSVLNGRSPPK